MHLRHLVAQLRNLRSPVDTYPTLVAFVMGFDHSTRGRFLADFGPWCRERFGAGPDAHWSATIRDNAPQDQERTTLLDALQAYVHDKIAAAPSWLDVSAAVPNLTSKPYFVASPDVPPLVDTLTGLGFQVVGVDVPEPDEETLLIALVGELGFSPVGAGSWASFNDHVWDLLAVDAPPLAVLISGLDAADPHTFTRCVHNLLSMTEGVQLEHVSATRQVEYFFVGADRTFG